MSKSPALGALAFLALATTACGQPPPEPPSPEPSPPEQGATPEGGVLPEYGVPPEYGVLYTSEPFNGVLIARTRDVSVRVEGPQRGDDESASYVVHVETPDGRSARHPFPEGNPLRQDEIYLLSGSACEQSLIDVVVRSAPPDHSDIPSYMYDRFLIDEETLELVALISLDPSVRVASGVTSVSSLTGGYWAVFSVTCDGGRIESLTVRDEYKY